MVYIKLFILFHFQTGGGGGGFRIFQGDLQDLQGLMAENLILVTTPNSEQVNPNRLSSLLSTTSRPISNGGNNVQYPPNTLIVVGANGELIPVNSVRGGINVSPSPSVASFATFNTGLQPPTTESLPLTSLTPGGLYSTVSRPLNPLNLGSTDFAQYRRQVLLGEAKRNQSIQSSTLSNDAEFNADVAVEDKNKDEGFPYQENSQLNSNQVADSVEEFQRAVEELRKRYAHLNKAKNGPGQQIAILL